MPTSPEKTPLTKEQSLVLGAINATLRGKKAYGDARRYQDELKALAGVDKEVALPDGRRYKIVDTFAGKSLAKKMTYIDRFELEEQEG